METIVGILIGIALSAACGFRVFVPLLVLGIAGRAGHVPLAGDAHWITATPALIALGTATVVEIVAYYVPWLDHALDTVATPAAVLAGVFATAAVVGNLPPVLRWGLALIAGGGAAGTVQGATVLARLKSGTLTAGLANPVVATAELTGSVVTSVLAVLAPLFAVALIVLLLVLIYRTTRKFFFGRRRAMEPAAPENETLDASRRNR
jgi:hypothetical protein